MAVTRDTLDELDRQRREIDAILNARALEARRLWEAHWGQVQDQLTSWADAWAELAEQLLLAQRNPYRAANLLAMRRVAEDELRGFLGDSTALSNDALGRLTLLANQHAAALTASQYPPPSRGLVAWQPTDPRVLARIVERATQQITARHYHLSTEATRSVRSALRLAAGAGDNPRRAARAMIARTEGVFNGGYARAEVIARTELLDGYRYAAAEAHNANADVLAGWQWLCELSSRTCPSCLAMNGSKHPLEEDGPIDHHQGRCSRVPLVKPLRELGIPGPEPRSAVPDARAWFARQPEAVQRQIMGPKRLEAWRAGKFPPERWTRLVETDGWRDAYHVGNPLP